MKPRMSMRVALTDPRWLGNSLPGASWALWRVLLVAAMGEPLSDDERVLFTSVTGRDVEPLERVAELWSVVGRRGGKTRAAATLGVYIAALCDWRDVLAPGERGILPILAGTTDQAEPTLNAAAGIIESSPGLSALMVHPSPADTIALTTGIDIQIMPANFRTVRGVTAISAIGEECAFWAVEGSKNPDAEILNAVRPALATTGGMLISLSSPYGRKGELYRTWRRDYGPDGDPRTLVVWGPSRAFNPTLPQEEVDRAYRRDPVAASAEFGGQFRADIETVLSREVVEAAVEDGVISRPRADGVRYVAFTDPSGGSSDSMCLAIAHRERDDAIVDVVLETKPPFSPEATVAEFSTLLKAFGITTVHGDQYGGQFVQEMFRRNGIQYRPAPIKSQLYLSLIGLMNSRRVALLDDNRSVEQLVSLERRTGRLGRDMIDHPPGSHDDRANVIAGAVWAAIGVRPSYTAGQLTGTQSSFAPPSKYSGSSRIV